MEKGEATAKALGIDEEVLWLSQKLGHRMGVDHMLLCQHTSSQCLRRILWQHGHHGLLQDGAYIQLGRDLMHGGTGKFASGIDGALMGVQPWKSGQQRRVDIQQPARKVLHKTGGENAHETRQHHQGRLIAVDLLGQCSIKSLAAGEILVVEHGGGNALPPGKFQTFGIGLVADNRRHLRAQMLDPGLLLGRLDDGCHIGAAARDQNHDVFHYLRIIPAMPFDHRTQPLSPYAIRVLATLMEKARTVPDSYPLTVNSLQAGCNQKTSRAPAMQLSEGEIQAALDELRQRHLVMEASGQRATRWEHNFERVVSVPSQASAILGLLMLRGPQTAGELRINTERWHRFADIGSVEAFLEELRDRSEEKGGPLVVLLPRAPGAREARWAHLLCGDIDFSALATASDSNTPHASSDTATAQRLATLEAEVAQLRATVQQLCTALGVEIPNAAPDHADPAQD